MPTPIVEQCAAPIAVDHTHYRAVVNPDGTFRSLQVGPAHLELLDLTQPANLLRACAPDGAPLERGTTSPATLTTSPLGQVLRAAGTLGPDVHTDVEIRFYRELPRIDVRLRLTCRHAVIGDFFDDETKLNVYWPLGFDGDVYHDIPFGAVQTRRDRPFFPVSWVDVHDGQRGLAYFNRGTQRHRVRGRTLANVIAWGDDTDHFGNRLTARPATRSYDQRLRGTHLIEYALYPHLGPWTTAGVVQAARSYRAPLYAVATEHHTGPLPPEHGLLDVGPPNLIVTAIELRDRDLRVRLYESTGRATSPHVRAARLQPRALTTLDNQPLTHLPPFRIAHLDLSRP